MTTVDLGDQIVIVTIHPWLRSDRRGDVQVEGFPVAPGLAIVPSLNEPDRFSLTHVPSGRAVIQGKCLEHIETVMRSVRDFPIDWTRAPEELVADEAVKDAARSLNDEAGFCYGRCNPSTPPQPSWRVYCRTCHWEWEDEFGEGPLDAETAKKMARDHDCQPEVQIGPPDSDRWLDPFFVNDDGTLKGSAPTRIKTITPNLGGAS
jgi:hypothetical protein